MLSIGPADGFDGAIIRILPHYEMIRKHHEEYLARLRRDPDHVPDAFYGALAFARVAVRAYLAQLVREYNCPN